MTRIFLSFVCCSVLLPKTFGSIEKMAEMKLIQSAANERVVRLVNRSLSHEISIKNKEFASNVSKSQQFHELSSIDSNLLKKTNKFIIHNDWNGDTEVFLITHSNDVFAFGSNKEGRLGFGDYGEVKEPKIIPELSGKSIEDIKCGFNGFCVALTRTGQIYTFGWNIGGQTGNGNYDSIQKPLEILIDNQTITAIACTDGNTFALTQSGQLYWFGNLNGNRAYYPTKVVFPSEVEIKSISCGDYHILAQTVDGKAFSWGNNVWGQLGLGHNKYEEDSPKMISLNENIKQISCGSYHSLILTTDGKVYSMGDNQWGQLGIGNKENQNSPQLVLNDQKEICCYRLISSSLDLNNKFYIWGYITEEELVSPVLSELTSFQEIINKYAKYYSTLKPIELFN